MGGALFVSSNNGAFWDRRYDGIVGDVDDPILAVTSDEDAVWNQGYSLLVTTDGGIQWSARTKLDNGGDPDVFSVPNPGDEWVLLAGRPTINGAALWHSNDGVNFEAVRPSK
jgi:hypothetical protein